MPSPPMSASQQAAKDAKVVEVIRDLMGPLAPFSLTSGSITTVGRKPV